MTLLASAFPSPSINLKVKVFASRSFFRLHGRVSTFRGFRRSPCCSMEGSPNEYLNPDNFKKQLIGISERVQEVVPMSLRDLPWRKAETLLLERLTSLGKTVLKWSFVAWFAFSALSDVLTSIASNQELMVPLGLLVGCLACDFLKETASEMLPGAEEKGLFWQFFGISFFFVTVKFLSATSGSRTRTFLLHFGNGGVLQLLWLFSGLSWRANSKSEPNYSPNDASN